MTEPVYQCRVRNPAKPASKSAAVGLLGRNHGNRCAGGGNVKRRYFATAKRRQRTAELARHLTFKSEKAFFGGLPVFLILKCRKVQVIGRQKINASIFAQREKAQVVHRNRKDPSELPARHNTLTANAPCVGMTRIRRPRCPRRACGLGPRRCPRLPCLIGRIPAWSKSSVKCGLCGHLQLINTRLRPAAKESNKTRHETLYCGEDRDKENAQVEFIV